MASKPTSSAARSAVSAQLFTVNQFCAATNTGRTTAYRLMDLGVLKYVVIGHDRRIPVSEVERIVAEGAPAPATLPAAEVSSTVEKKPRSRAATAPERASLI